MHVTEQDTKLASKIVLRRVLWACGTCPPVVIGVQVEEFGKHLLSGLGGGVGRGHAYSLPFFSQMKSIFWNFFGRRENQSVIRLWKGIWGAVSQPFPWFLPVLLPVVMERLEKLRCMKVSGFSFASSLPRTHTCWGLLTVLPFPLAPTLHLIQVGPIPVPAGCPVLGLVC